MIYRGEVTSCLTINEFLFQVREQLGENRMRAQQEQNGVADVHPSQVRVQRSQGTRIPLSQSTGQYLISSLLLFVFIICGFGQNVIKTAIIIKPHDHLIMAAW